MTRGITDGITEGGLFPKEWDAARDLFVAVGRGAEELLGRLAAQGQQRMLVYLPEEADTATLPGNAIVAHSPMDVLDGILSVSGPMPKRVVIKRQSDPWVSDETNLEVKRTVEEGLRSKRMQMGTLNVQGTTWLKHGIANLAAAATHPSVACLRGAFENRPCVIVSPGPSLAKNVHLLAGLKGRAVLMTCSHALMVMQRAGVAPDLALVADPGPLIMRHYEGVELGGFEALLIGATCHPDHFRQPARRLFTFASNDQVDDWIFQGVGEDARLRTGGSVACSELSLALLMGCDPIVFVGQDLSFSEERYYFDTSIDASARVKVAPDGRTFYLAKPGGTEAPGSPDDDGELRTTLPQELSKVQGYHGGEVPTSQSFHAFLIWFEAVARSLADRTMLFNCTEGGAHIRGMEHRTLEDVAAAYCREEFEVASVLDRAASSVDSAARRASMANHVRGMLDALAPCLELAKRCQQLAAGAAGRPELLHELQAAERELSGALKPVRFLSLLAQADILRAQEQASEAKTLEENLAAARLLFSVVERAGNELREPLEEALSELTEE